MKNKIFTFIVLFLIGIYAWWAIPQVNAITQITDIRGSGQTTGSVYRISGTSPSWQKTQMNTATDDADRTTTSATFADMTSMSVTLTTGANPVLIGFSGGFANDTVAVGVYFTVDIDGVNQGDTNGLIYFNAPVAGYVVPVAFTYQSAALTAASHTFKIQWRTTSNTATTQGANTPTKMWVVELK